MKSSSRMNELVGVLILAVLSMLPACGNNDSQNSNAYPVEYSVGGTVSNLLADGLVLQNNSKDDLAVEANSTSFTFPTSLATGESYSVTIKSQPVTQSCVVTQESLTVESANVTNVGVECFKKFVVMRGDQLTGQEI